MDLTVNEIMDDIAEYEDRIHLAKLSLSELPKGRLPYPEHKRREQQRKDCEAEIKHCFQLIRYANDRIKIRSSRY